MNPPRSESASETGNALEAGREAARRHAWHQAYELLRAADAEAPLSPADLELLAEAASWSSRLHESLEASERAYGGYIDGGERARAARVALTLAIGYRNKGAPSIAAGWHARAARLLEAEPEAAAHGHLALVDASFALFRGDLEEAFAQATRAVEIGVRFGDRDLQALAILRQGQVQVRRGDLSRGLALLDEATAAAVGGELTPFTTGTIYCATIDACRDLGDYSRAGEWTDTAIRWCERESIAGFPGLCRVDRAGIMRFRGEFDQAEDEARRACDELKTFSPRVAGAAFAEIGEIRLRRGDLGVARDAFASADELGWEAQPGRALLRLAEGKVERAARELRDALAEEESNRLARARLLPALVEIEIRGGELERAAAAAVELEEIAETYGSSTLHAHAAAARGAVQLAEGDAEGATRCLRKARRLWQETNAPYEEARTRVLLAQADRATGDEDEALAELRAARETFERLEAVLDAQRVAELLGEASARRTFLFSDIVGSTRTAEFLGPEKWKKVLAWHDRTLADLIREAGGEVIKNTGDGFFAAFETPRTAVEAAVSIQRTLRDHEGFAPDVRIGLHSGAAFSKDGGDYGGEGVHAAARVGALAEAGEILASHETVRGEAVAVRLSEPRSIEARGLPEPLEVVTVEWT